MIRFLQKDSKALKIVFVLIIGVAAITMVITLVPGIFADETTSSDTYATVRSPGVLGRYFGSSSEILEPEVQQVAQRMLEQQKLPDQLLPYLEPRAAEALIQREILVQQANRMGFRVSDADLRRALQTGSFGSVLFPNGQFIGQDRYADFVENYFHTSTQDFEAQLKKEVEIDRLESAVTGGITISDPEVRDAYLQQATKIKFDYAVLNADDLRKQINPTDTELQTFFKQNAKRYATAIPETRKVSYISFNSSQLPGGAPQITEAQIDQYYQQHQKDFQVPDQVQVRHILIQVAPNADAAADAAAKQKAEDVLKQLRAGGNFADLAKKYSDDPGSKDKGGDLGWIQHGVTVPAFENVAFALQPGQLSGVVKTQFGYHIIQVEQKQQAHLKPLDEVKGQILATLTQQAEAAREAAFAQQLANEAAKTGLAGAAAAHQLKVVQSDYLEQNAIVPGIADASKLLNAAFSTRQGAPPQTVSTGDGYAVFQVDSVKAAHAPTFDEYKSHLLDDFREQQLPQLLARKTNELADKAQAEGSLEKAAKELGATMKTSELVDRNSQVPDIGLLGSAAGDIFSLKQGQISKAINTGRTGVVVKIDEKQEPSAAEVAKNLDTTRDQLLAARREEMFSVFVTNLTDRYEKQGLVRMTKRQAGAVQIPG